MIGYITLGTNDLARSVRFYDELLSVIGAKRTAVEEDYIVWGTEKGGAMFSIHIPYDRKEATVGNGVMIALAANDAEHVKALHRKALDLGGQDEGQPGPRGDTGFYAAYFRDLDGNKLNAHCMVADKQ